MDNFEKLFTIVHQPMKHSYMFLKFWSHENIYNVWIFWTQTSNTWGDRTSSIKMYEWIQLWPLLKLVKPDTHLTISIRVTNSIPPQPFIALCLGHKSISFSLVGARGRRPLWSPCVKSRSQNWDPTSWKSRPKSFQVSVLETENHVLKVFRFRSWKP
jgi:hypothetical protein